MDSSMIQNVSAAALRSKGRTYSVTGTPVTERVNVPVSRSSPPSSPGVFNPAAARSAPLQSDIRAAAQSASSGIKKQQGLVTYSKLMQIARENRFRTRYDLLI